MIRFDLKNKIDMFNTHQQNHDFFRNINDESIKIFEDVQKYEKYLFDVSDIFLQIQKFTLDNILRIFQILGDNYYIVLDSQNQ